MAAGAAAGPRPQAPPAPAAMARAWPKTSVITVSTPSSTMRAQVVGPVDRPGVDGQAQRVGPLDQLGRHRQHEGVDGPEAGGGRLLEPGPGVGRHAPQGAQRQPLVGRLHRPQRGRLEGRDQHPVRPAGGVDRLRRQGGDQLGGVPPGVGRRVLDLHVHRHAVADGQDVGQQGHVAGELGDPQLGDHPHARDLGIVVDGQRPVLGQADVEFHPVGPQTAGLGEGLDRVLPEAPLRATPVCKDGSHCILPG